MNNSGEEKNKEFCAKCGVEFYKYEMVRRKNEKGNIEWLCVYCASKYQN